MGSEDSFLFYFLPRLTWFWVSQVFSGAYHESSSSVSPSLPCGTGACSVNVKFGIFKWKSQRKVDSLNHPAAAVFLRAMSGVYFAKQPWELRLFNQTGRGTWLCVTQSSTVAPSHRPGFAHWQCDRGYVTSVALSLLTYVMALMILEPLRRG